jgi:beta-lactamase class A
MLASRRDFLKGAAALSALSLLPPSLRVLASPLSNDSLDAVTAFLTAMERPYAAPVNLPFERIIGNKTIGLLLYDVNNARLMTALNPEKLFPVASAFKAPLLMYFLDQIDPDVWNIVPVEAWSAATTADVPEDAHDAWRQHY